MAESDKSKKLRVLDEEGPTEEVLRLGNKGKLPEAVERVPLPAVPEEAARLEQAGGVDEFDRRSIEPDIDSIIGPSDENAFDEDSAWMKSGDSKSVPYGWFAMILLLVVGLAITSAVLVLRSSGGDGQEAKRAAVERLEVEEEDDAEATALVESVEEVLRRTITAESIEELLPIVRDRERVKPLMEDWYGRNPMEPREFEGLGVFQPLDIKGRLFWLVTCLIEGDKPETILMEQTEDGRVFVDWETMVCYQPMSWSDYAEQRPSGDALEFRVYLQPDLGGFYSHEFSDEERWSVYRLLVKGSKEHLFGYAEKGSELDERIKELVKSNRGYPAALLVKLRIPEGTESPRGVVIDEVLSERWAIVEPLTGG